MYLDIPSLLLSGIAIMAGMCLLFVSVGKGNARYFMAGLALIASPFLISWVIELGRMQQVALQATADDFKRKEFIAFCKGSSADPITIRKVDHRENTSLAIKCVPDQIDCRDYGIRLRNESVDRNKFFCNTTSARVLFTEHRDLQRPGKFGPTVPVSICIQPTQIESAPTADQQLPSHILLIGNAVRTKLVEAPHAFRVTFYEYPLSLVDTSSNSILATATFFRGDWDAELSRGMPESCPRFVERAMALLSGTLPSQVKAEEVHDKKVATPR